MQQQQFQRGTFHPYQATVKVHLGKIERDIHPGECLETDGYTVKFDGEEFAMPTVRTAIAEAWFVPLGDTSGRKYISQPAGIQMHSATPDRDGNRQQIQFQVAAEDHHVVGSVAQSTTGASSQRTRDIRANQQPPPQQWQQPPPQHPGQMAVSYQAGPNQHMPHQQSAPHLQQQWQQEQAWQQQQHQAQVHDMQGAGAYHQPLPESDPRHATQRVDPSQMSPHEFRATVQLADAQVAVPLPPTSKAADEETRKVIKPGNAHAAASSVMAGAERRSQQRQLQSRQQAAAQRRAMAARTMQGQAVGVSSLGPQGGPRHQGGDFNQQNPQVVRTVSGPQPAWQQPQMPPQQWAAQQAPPPQQMAPPGPVPAQPSQGDWAEYQEFLAFKQMKAQAAQQGRQAAQMGLAQGHAPPVQAQPQAAPVPAPEAAPAPAPAPPTPDNWATSMKGVQWAKRARIASEMFGNDPGALQKIAAVESPGVQKAIQKRIDSMAAE